MSKEIEIQTGETVTSRVISGETLAQLRPLLQGQSEIYIVYDEQAAWVAGELAALPGVKGCIGIETSEALKTLDTVLMLCRNLMEAGASRSARILAVGGGITTDMAGFAASIYKRGVRYANVPTTLLAQVDAAIGGKTGVNLDAYKNMLGVIVQPQFTFLCPEVLKTLPERDFRSGVAELLKTFLIGDGAAYEEAVRLLSKPSVAPSALGPLIFRAASIKAGVVSRDPFEKGERRVLNLGHTFAHAIEHEAAVCGDDITHGEAVAVGMVLAARLADRLGVTESPLEDRLKADFAAVGLPAECPYPTKRLVGAMAKDKKATGEGIAFVLPVRPGEVIIRELSPAFILSCRI